MLQSSDDHDDDSGMFLKPHLCYLLTHSGKAGDWFSSFAKRATGRWHDVAFKASDLAILFVTRCGNFDRF